VQLENGKVPGGGGKGGSRKPFNRERYLSSKKSECPPRFKGKLASERKSGESVEREGNYQPERKKP